VPNADATGSTHDNGTDDPATSRILSLIRDIPDYPSPGVMFKDITPLLADAAAFAGVIDQFAAPYRAPGSTIDVVVGIEARGFILAAPLAIALGAGFVPVRKSGKLPHITVGAAYALEYGTAQIEVHVDGIAAGQRVLVVDDVLATGGTAQAACSLVEQVGGQVAGVDFLMELAFLGGRSKLAGHRIRALVTL
jgi:adenine phosphoribosyltransferase